MRAFLTGFVLVLLTAACADPEDPTGGPLFSLGSVPNLASAVGCLGGFGKLPCMWASMFNCRRLF